jgi:cob(I)alamin adenosyltransferase
VKAYTGGGDRGKTSLLSGERVAKTHCRIEACGDVDELNCALGAFIAALPQEDLGLRTELLEAQGDLFRLGARLSTASGSTAASLLPSFGPPQTRRLEAAIDKLEAELPPLQGFILPGGHASAAWAHLARTVCRRAERRVVQCALESKDTDPGQDMEGAIAYLNRLSTFLFTAARVCNKLLGVTERTWQA